MQGFVNLINFYFGNIRRLTYQMFTLRKCIILRKKMLVLNLWEQ